MEFLKKYLNKEVILYIIFGVLTTLLHFILYELLMKIGIRYELANLSAIVVSIIFAYITNKIWVFESKAYEFKEVTKEMLLFFSGRVLTLIIDMVLLIALVEVFDISKTIARILVSGVVIVLNYLISKKGAFRK